MRVRHVQPPSNADPAARRRDERGETLLEVLVMIVLMGVGFTAIFGGMITVSKVNSANARRTQASIAIQSWAEGLQQPATQLTAAGANYTYIDCATAATYGHTGQQSNSMPATWAAATVNAAPVLVEYLTGFNSAGEPQFTSNVNTCYSSGDKGLQRITIKLETPPGTSPRVVDSLVFIKRNQSCPPVGAFDNADLGPC